MEKKISNYDLENFVLLRKNISEFIQRCSDNYDEGLLLDIAPQDHVGAKEWFKKSLIETLDIDPVANATYTADLCKNNSQIIEDNRFDGILCSEVLEHTLNPFLAVSEIRRILKMGGYAFFSAPFNFRIHGPLPDCWRFSEHGWKALLHDGWEVIELKALESDRFLMPIHYTIIAKKISNYNE